MLSHVSAITHWTLSNDEVNLEIFDAISRKKIKLTREKLDAHSQFTHPEPYDCIGRAHNAVQRLHSIQLAIGQRV